MVQEIQNFSRRGATAARTKVSLKPVLRTQAPEAARLLQLIDAAEDIFLAKGYHTATMNDVAKAAGMSKKTVYQLIESKSELFVALLEHHQSKLVFPAIQDSWTIREVLVENLLCLGRFILSPQQIAIVRLIMAEYTHSNDFGRIFHQKRVVKVKSRLEDCLIDVARDRMNMGDAKEMAAMLFGMALGEFHLSVMIGFRPMPTKAALERRVRCAVNLFLSGHETISHP